MARLIVKSPYIRCGGGKSAGGYLKYIATRERVEIIPDDRPPTNKQEQLIAKLVKDFPDTKTLYEYESFQTKPTKAAASAFITLALESNWDFLLSHVMFHYKCIFSFFRHNQVSPEKQQSNNQKTKIDKVCGISLPERRSYYNLNGSRIISP